MESKFAHKYLTFIRPIKPLLRSSSCDKHTRNCYRPNIIRWRLLWWCHWQDFSSLFEEPEKSWRSFPSKRENVFLARHTEYSTINLKGLNIIICGVFFSPDKTRERNTDRHSLVAKKTVSQWTSSSSVVEMETLLIKFMIDDQPVTIPSIPPLLVAATTIRCSVLYQRGKESARKR